MTNKSQIDQLLEIIGERGGSTYELVEPMQRGFSAFKILSQIIEDETESVDKRACAVEALVLIYHEVANKKCANYFETILSKHWDWDLTILVYVLGGIEYCASPYTVKALTKALNKTQDYRLQQKIIGVMLHTSEFMNQEKEFKKALCDFLKNGNQHHPKAVRMAQSYSRM